MDKNYSTIIDKYIQKAKVDLQMDYVILGPYNPDPAYLGYPTYENLEQNVFDFSRNAFLMDDQPYETAWIVIDDFSRADHFEFDTDMTLDYATLKGWLEGPDLRAKNIGVVVIGRNSGLASPHLCIASGTVIFSQGSDTFVDPDTFDVAQHLDSNFDWHDAFQKALQQYLSQNPTIY